MQNVGIRGPVRRALCHTLQTMLVAFYLAESAQAFEADSTLDDPKSCNVYFYTNSASLSPSAVLVLSDFIQRVRVEPVKQISLVGHADRQGSKTYNLALSRRRARTVKQYLASHLRPMQIVFRASGTGEINLPYQTGDGVDEPLNRCVSIIVEHTVLLF
jgi:outer membrane protein OmpA-like peptidoglycan-associated protein